MDFTPHFLCKKQGEFRGQHGRVLEAPATKNRDIASMSSFQDDLLKNCNSCRSLLNMYISIHIFHIAYMIFVYVWDK